MNNQDDTGYVSPMPKESKAFLDAMNGEVVSNISDYFVVKRFADEFNRHAVPALKEAGVKTVLRAEFVEAGTVCEIRAGGVFSTPFVIPVTAETLKEDPAHIAKAVLNAMSLDDREKVQHNLSRVLGMK